MEPLQIRGELLNVDVRGELEAFEWHRPTWRGDKLIAASPFRPDNTPSFFVRLEAYQGHDAGLWTDSGANGTENEKGGLVQLLAYLRRESWDDTELYLINKYGTNRERAKRLVPPTLKTRRLYKPLQIETSIHIAVSKYLSSRGISDEVQIAAKCGKPLLLHTNGYTALPWFNVQGELKNLKYRSTTGKKFFYERDGQPISELVFGADLYLHHDGELVVCEAEIDALSWRTAGVSAIAVGGSNLNQKQADVINRLPCTTIIIAGDNDEAGAKLTKKAAQLLRGKILKRVSYNDLDAKDANDVLINYGSDRLEHMARSALLLPLDRLYK